MIVPYNYSIDPYEPPDALKALIQKALVDQHRRLGQLDIPRDKRTRTAINYGMHIKSLFNFLQWKGYSLPRSIYLEEWRDGMAAGTVPRKYVFNGEGEITHVYDFRHYSVNGINARIAAVRSLLRGAAREIPDLQWKQILKDWALVKQLKLHEKQDKLEEDFGIRLSIEELSAFINNIDKSDIFNLRDRALVALMAGAGLRVNEATNLTMKDIFGHTTDDNIPAIYVRKGKGDKSRLVALSQDSWVLKTVQEFTDALGLDVHKNPHALVIIRLKAKRMGSNRSLKDVKVINRPISSVMAWNIITSYPATHKGKPVTIRPHDLRRTYALLCHEAGMDWNALRANLGHKDIATTQIYVGRATSLVKRVPDWSI